MSHGVKATRAPGARAERRLVARRAGKRFVIVNADAILGPLLASQARRQGAICGPTHGDQQAPIAELGDWAAGRAKVPSPAAMPLDGEGGRTVYGRVVRAGDAMSTHVLPMRPPNNLRLIRQLAAEASVTCADVAALPHRAAAKMQRELVENFSYFPRLSD